MLNWIESHSESLLSTSKCGDWDNGWKLDNTRCKIGEAACRRVSPAVAACCPCTLALSCLRHSRPCCHMSDYQYSLLPVSCLYMHALNGIQMSVSRWIVRCHLRTYQSHNRTEYLRETTLDIFIDCGTPNDRYRCISSTMEKIRETKFKFSLNFTIFSRN